MNSSPAKSTYVFVWLALMGLLLLTWGVAALDLGIMNTVVALLIAGAKMSIIMLFFMHVRFNNRLTWLFAGAGFVWLAFMITLTLTDYRTRREVVPYARENVLPQSSPQTNSSSNRTSK